MHPPYCLRPPAWRRAGRLPGAVPLARAPPVTWLAPRRGATRDGNGKGRVRVKHLPGRWYTRLSLVYPYPPNVMGKNPYPYPQDNRIPAEY
jgi:hypothetical protein